MFTNGAPDHMDLIGCHSGCSVVTSVHSVMDLDPLLLWIYTRHGKSANYNSPFMRKLTNRRAVSQPPFNDVADLQGLPFSACRTSHMGDERLPWGRSLFSDPIVPPERLLLQIIESGFKLHAPSRGIIRGKSATCYHQAFIARCSASRSLSLNLSCVCGIYMSTRGVGPRRTKWCVQ